MSIREAFKAVAAAGPKVEVVPVPGLGDVRVRAISGADYDEYEMACAAAGVGEKGKKVAKACRHLLVRLSVVDDDGKPVFGPADDDFLKSLPLAVVNPITQKAAELAGLGGDDAGND